VRVLELVVCFIFIYCIELNRVFLDFNMTINLHKSVFFHIIEKYCINISYFYSLKNVSVVFYTDENCFLAIKFIIVNL